MTLSAWDVALVISLARVCFPNRSPRREMLPLMSVQVLSLERTQQVMPRFWSCVRRAAPSAVATWFYSMTTRSGLVLLTDSAVQLVDFPTEAILPLFTSSTIVAG